MRGIFLSIIMKGGIEMRLRKILSALLMLTVILSSSSVFAYGWEHSSSAYKVNLYSNQTKSYSSYKKDPYMYFEGKNTSEKRRVYFKMQYSSDKSNWNDDVYLLLSPGADFSKSKTTERTSKPYWRLCLDAYGPLSGATAYGWTW